MKYKFQALMEDEIYEDVKVLFVIGKYGVFNNIAIDRVKGLCGTNDKLIATGNILSDFEISEEELRNTEMSNNVSFEEFIQVIGGNSLSGKWFSSVDFGYLVEKKKNWILNYIKHPLDTGKLVVYCSEYSEYKELLRNRIIQNSKEVHLIQLDYPTRKVLMLIVNKLFEDKGYSIDRRAVDFFILRMSSSYDDYMQTVDKIIVEAGASKDITYEIVANAMRGIENFVVDDLLNSIILGTKEDRIYKMVYMLKEEFGINNLVKQILYKIEQYIEFRVAINSGIIPIKVRFSVPEAKERLGEESKLNSLPDFLFRRMANTSSKTSLLDLVCMKLILMKNINKMDKDSYDKALILLINRRKVNKDRLFNEIGIGSIQEIEERYIKNIKQIHD